MNFKFVIVEIPNHPAQPAIHTSFPNAVLLFFCLLSNRNKMRQTEVLFQSSLLFSLSWMEFKTTYDSICIHYFLPLCFLKQSILLKGSSSGMLFEQSLSQEKRAGKVCVRNKSKGSVREIKCMVFQCQFFNSCQCTLHSESLVSPVASLPGKIKSDMWHVRVNGAAFNKDYCRGQRDNKRELCGAADNMTGPITDIVGGGRSDATATWAVFQ